LLLIVRAQNQASGALRRIANDVRGLSRVQDLGLRKNQLAIQQASAMRQQRRALNELESVTTGRRYMQALTQKNNLLQRASLQTGYLASAINRQELAQSALQKAEKKGIGTSTARWKRLNSQAITAATAVERNRTAINNIGRDLANVDQRFRNYAQRASVLNSELATTRQRLTNLAAQQLALNREITAARWDRFQIAGRTIAHLGRVAQLTGLVMAAGIGYAADAAAKFQTQVTLVATQTGKAGSGIKTVTKNAKELNDIILRQMPKSIATTEDLTASTYDLFSSVDSANKSFLTLADGAKLLNLANKAAIAGQTDLKTAVESIVRPMNTFGFSAEKMPATLNRMFAAVRFGELTFGQFASTLQTTAPAAKAAGQSFDTLSGTMAFLSRRLGDTKAAVGFARLTEILSREKFISGAKKAGVAMTDTAGRLKQLPDVIDALVTKFPKLEKGGVFLSQFFKDMSGTEGTIQARRAFVFLAQQLGQYQEMVKRVSKDNVEFDRSFKALNETAGVKWVKFMNTIRALMLQFGAAAIPTLLEMVKPIQDLVKWFSNLDDETKQQIGRWATWAAAIALIGGTILAVGGSIIAFIAVLGKMRILMPGMIGGLIAFALIAKTITGNWSDVGDLISGVFDQITGSWSGMAIGAAAAVAAIFKVNAAVKSMRVTMAATGTAQAAGGFLPMLIGAPASMNKSISTLKRFNAAARLSGASRGAAILKTAGAAAVMLPGPLKLAAAAMAAFGVGALIWQHHADAMREKAEMLARAQEDLARSILKPAEAARAVGNLSESFRDVKRAGLDVDDLTARLKDLRKQLQDTEGVGARAQIKRDIERVILDRADAYAVQAEAAKVGAQRIRGMNRYLDAQSAIFGKIAVKQQAIKNLQDQLRVAGQAGVIGRVGDNEAILGQIDRLRAGIDQLRGGSRNASTAMHNAFMNMVADLQKMGELPKKITPNMVADLEKLAIKLGRMPTLKEQKLFFKAELDPKSMKDLPAMVQRLIRGEQQKRHKLKVATDLSFDAARVEHLALKTGQVPKVKVGADISAAKQQVQLFKRVAEGIHIKKFQIGTMPTGNQLGQNLAAGIVAGTQGLQAALTATLIAQVDGAVAAVKSKYEIHSPSEYTAREIGSPFVKGIIGGMLREMSGVDLAAKQTAAEWAKAWKDAFKQAKDQAVDFLKGYYDDIRSELSGMFFDKPFGDLNQIRRDWGVALSVKELTADLKSSTRDLRKYGNQWDKLQSRGAPLKMLQQLQAMGEDGQVIIKTLANATPKQLRNYVKAWKAAQKELNKQTRAQFKDQIKEWKKMGKSIAIGIMLGLKSETPGLMQYMRHIFQQMFNAAQHQNKSKSPSKLYAEEGRNMMRGLQMGIDSLAKPTVGGSRLTGGGFGSLRPAGDINMVVHAQHSESLDSTLARASFRLRNRRP
jgi:TP901 family phage tail tape measure protein